jgi:hypothetical protein
MTTRDRFADVAFLLPARVHQDHARFVAALRAELAAIIAGLPTANRSPNADPRQDRGGVQPVLPPHPTEETDDGHP